MRKFSNGTNVQLLGVADLLVDAGDQLLNVIAEYGPARRIVYSDPPWNPGNEKWWRRYAGASEPSDYRNLLDAWCRCVAGCNPTDIFCEQSINDKHRSMFTQAAERCVEWHLPLLEGWVVCYGPKSARLQNKLLHYGHVPILTDPTGMHGEPMTRCVVDGLGLHDEAAVFIDPCTGLGMTSRQAHLHSADFIGTELNETRLDKTIKWLIKHGYREVA
jgi:hypothetical protein